MFDKFLLKFSQDSRADDNISEQILLEIDEFANGFSELMQGHSGATFCRGLYRLHRVQDISSWTVNLESAFPIYKNRIICFGFDWLGRHFVLDNKRVQDSQRLILLLEPGTGEAMEIPTTFIDFHNKELIDYGNEALSSNFFQEWLSSGGSCPSHTECVGYKVPLFLNGKDEIYNLELSDMDVYWSICGQLLKNVKNS